MSGVRRKKSVSAARAAELEQAAAALMMALWNIDAVALLLDRVPALHEVDFGDEVAGGIRAIQSIASHTAAKWEGVL